MMPLTVAVSRRFARLLVDPAYNLLELLDEQLGSHASNGGCEAPLTTSSSSSTSSWARMPARWMRSPTYMTRPPFPVQQWGYNTIHGRRLLQPDGSLSLHEWHQQAV